MEKKTIWIIVAIVVLIFVVGYFAMAAKQAPVIPPVNPAPTPTSSPSKTNLIGTIGNILNRFFGKKVTGYVQVQPIDANGCDANGFNAIGVSCSVIS